MNKKTIIKWERMAEIQKKRDVNVPFEHSTAAEVFYEEGVNQVLREVARRQLIVKDGFDVEDDEAFVQKRKKVSELIEQMGTSCPDDLMSEFDSDNGHLMLLAMDGAFKEGFIAGYRFLKELMPD
jgi:hypothetical protein